MKVKTYKSWSLQDEQWAFELERGEACYFYLKNGKRLYDFSSTSFQSSFGHAHPQIIEAMTKQLRLLPIASVKAGFDLKTQVSDQLLNLLNLKAGKIYYTSTGSESVENAIKMARQIKQRKVICSRQKCYHGSSLGALSLTGDWRNDPHYTIDEWTLRIPDPYEDPETKRTRELIEEFGPEKIAAVIVESISGVNGVIIPPDSWWRGLQRLADDYDLFIIIDEVLCGFYRTGMAFGFQHFPIKPDLVCLSKAISGGHIPFGAVWTNEEIAHYYSKNVLACGSTHYAHPVGLAAAKAVCNLLNDSSFLRHVQAVEQIFEVFCEAIAQHPKVEKYYQQGLLAAIYCRHRPDFRDFVEAGLYVIISENRIILAPPLISTDEDLSLAFERLEACL